jgi:hypothetical protein
MIQPVDWIAIYELKRDEMKDFERKPGSASHGIEANLRAKWNMVLGNCDIDKFRCLG